MASTLKAREIAQALITAATTGPDYGATVMAARGVPVPTSGYVVALKGRGVTYLTDTCERFPHAIVDAAAEYVARHLPFVAFTAGTAFGSWSADGVTYLDVVKIHSERMPAILAGKQAGEIAIFDLTTSSTIYV